MKSIVQCLLWCLFLGVNLILAEGDLEDVNESVQQKIVGGYTVKEGALPYQCYLRVKWGIQFCGGSIINHNYVLSAAHCFDKLKKTDRYGNTHYEADKVEVVAGVISTHYSANMVVRDIKRLHVHESYRRYKYWVNDIALIQVDKPYAFSNRLTPISLNKNPVREGTQCTVSGWGRMKGYSNEGSEVLMAATVPMIGHKQCAAMYPGCIDQNSMICAGFTHGKITACKGDSGGPLVCNNQLVGVVSWGNEICDTPNQPGVFADVSKFIPWIRARMAQNY